MKGFNVVDIEVLGIFIFQIDFQGNENGYKYYHKNMDYSKKKVSTALNLFKTKSNNNYYIRNIK